MIGDLMYIELKTGYSYDGPAWIGYVKTSKSKKRIFEWEEIEIQILLIYNDLEEEVWLLGKYDLVTDKKREKARERLEVVTAQKEKIEARVLKYQQAIIESTTDKQKERAEQGLSKAMSSLEVALKKVADAQVQYDMWINQ